MGTGEKGGEELSPRTMRRRWRRTDEREGKRGREVGGAAVRLNSDKRDVRGVRRRRRRRREWLGGGGSKEKEKGAE